MQEKIIDVYIHDNAYETYKAIITSENLIQTRIGLFCSLSGLEVTNTNPKDIKGLVLKKGLFFNIRNDRWVLVSNATQIHDLFHKEELEVLSKFCSHTVY